MIYLLEDDENIRELVVYTLNSSGLEAKGFARPSEFWNEMESEILGESANIFSIIYNEN